MRPIRFTLQVIPQTLTQTVKYLIAILGLIITTSEKTLGQIKSETSNKPKNENSRNSKNHKTLQQSIDQSLVLNQELYYEYQVKPNDTLYRISQKHKITLKQLLAKNPQFKRNPDLIFPGDKIYLPKNQPKLTQETQKIDLSKAPVLKSRKPNNNRQNSIKLPNNEIFNNVPTNLQKEAKLPTEANNDLTEISIPSISTKNNIKTDEEVTPQKTSVKNIELPIESLQNSEKIATRKEDEKTDLFEKMQFSTEISPLKSSINSIAVNQPIQINLKGNLEKNTEETSNKLAMGTKLPTHIFQPPQNKTKTKYVLSLPTVPFNRLGNDLYKDVTQEIDANSLNFNGYQWPAQGLISSQFGDWRPGGRQHKGLDIANATGTPIYAAADGYVIFSGWNSGGYGNLIILEHPNGDQSYYAHNLVNRVQVGQKVQQGQWIAEMGSTGRSSGPHLHFEIRRRIRHDLIAQNPIHFLASPK